MKHLRRAFLVSLALLLSLLLSGCGYSEGYVMELREEINRLEEENAELESEIEYRLEDQYGRFVSDLENAWQEFHDPDDMLYRLEEINGSYDARQIVDGPYRQAFDAFCALFSKYY